MKRKATASPARSAMKLLCTLLGLILAVMLGATLYFQHLLGQINYVDPDAFLQLSQEELDRFLAADDQGDADSTAPVIDAEDVEFADHDTLIGGKGSGIVNILLIGQDRREGEGRARSDSMILCTFNKQTRQLTMTSFLRDLYVEIPGYNNNRINAAYAAGGMSLLNKTLEKNFGIHVDGNVEVDFGQFSDIIDLLGGVEIELRQDEANYINRNIGTSLTAGTHLLTGSQALEYARIRSLDGDGDFSRTSRQRKVINALISAYKNSSLTTILSLLDDILPMITTDMSNGEIIGYATELFPLLSDAKIVSQRVPADGSYSGKMIDGMSVLVADMDAARQMLEQTLLGQ